MVADRDRKDEYEALEVHRMSFFYESNQAEMIVTRGVMPYILNKFRLKLDLVTKKICYCRLHYYINTLFHKKFLQNSATVISFFAAQKVRKSLLLNTQESYKRANNFFV